jgi:hypothetical protein
MYQICQNFLATHYRSVISQIKMPQNIQSFFAAPFRSPLDFSWENASNLPKFRRGALPLLLGV